MQDKNKKGESEILIPLRRLALNGPYSLSRIYRLAKVGKIKSIKIGRVYYTRLDWFNDYLFKMEGSRKEKSTVAGDKLRQALEEYMPAPPGDGESQDQMDIDEKLLAKWQEVFKIMDFNYSDNITTTKESREKHWRNCLKRLGKESFYIKRFFYFLRQEVDTARQETLEKLSPRPWAIKLVAACLVALIFSVSIGRLTPQTADKLVEKTDRVVFYPLNVISRLAGRDNAFISQAIIGKRAAKLPTNNSSLSAYIADHQIELKDLMPGKTYAISMGDEIGQVAGAAAKADLKAGTNMPLSITGFIKQESNYAAKTISSYAQNVFHIIANKQKQLSIKLDNKLLNLFAN
jgi:hypothetical protein